MTVGATAERTGSHGSPGDDFPLTAYTGFLLHKAALLLVEDVEAALESTGIRARYFFVLASLASGLKLSQQDLSRLLNLDRTTVVTVIDEMEANHHVERRRDPADRRRYNLFLTEAGRDALIAAEKVAARVEETFFAGLEEGEAAVLRGMLGRLLDGRWPASVCLG